jgi:hypothetical protein
MRVGPIQQQHGTHCTNPIIIIDRVFSNAFIAKEAVPSLRALAADFQPFFLCLGNKTTFYFPIKKYLTIDSLTFPYIN